MFIPKIWAGWRETPSSACVPPPPVPPGVVFLCGVPFLMERAQPRGDGLLPGPELGAALQCKGTGFESCTHNELRSPAFRTTELTLGFLLTRTALCLLCCWSCFTSQWICQYFLNVGILLNVCWWFYIVVHTLYPVGGPSPLSPIALLIVRAVGRLPGSIKLGKMKWDHGFPKPSSGVCSVVV